MMGARGTKANIYSMQSEGPFPFNEAAPPKLMRNSLTSKAEKGKKIFCLRLPFREVRNLSSWRG